MNCKFSFYIYFSQEILSFDREPLVKLFLLNLKKYQLNRPYACSHIILFHELRGLRGTIYLHEQDEDLFTLHFCIFIPVLAVCAGFRENGGNFLHMVLHFGLDQNSADNTGMF